VSVSRAGPWSATLDIPDPHYYALVEINLPHDEHSTEPWLQEALASDPEIIYLAVAVSHPEPDVADGTCKLPEAFENQVEF
jgi:hypothetical protein